MICWWGDARLLPQKDLPGGPHVLSSLGGSLVGSGLESNDSFSSLDDIIGELTLVLFRWPGPQPWTLMFWMTVSSSAKGEDGVGDCGDILLLIKINGLEQIDFRHPIAFNCLLEVVDILHHLELPPGFVDLWDGTWFELIHQFAKDDTIMKSVFIWDSGELLAQDGFHPFLSFPFLIYITLSSELWKDKSVLSSLESVIKIRKGRLRNGWNPFWARSSPLSHMKTLFMMVSSFAN